MSRSVLTRAIDRYLSMSGVEDENIDKLAFTWELVPKSRREAKVAELKDEM